MKVKGIERIEEEGREKWGGMGEVIITDQISRRPVGAWFGSHKGGSEGCD